MTALLFPVLVGASGHLATGWLPDAAVALAASFTIASGAFAIRISTHRGRLRQGVQLAPVMLDHLNTNWGRASVFASPLVIHYQGNDGELSKSVIHPKNIQGERISSNRVRPDIINAFCEVRQDIHTFRIRDIQSAADARTGEFIDDLYTYLGSAQPGGAPSPRYQASRIST